MEKWGYTLGYSGLSALRREQCGMSAESQNFEASRDIRLLGKGSENTPIARQWLSSCHVMAADQQQ
jgi:hypothetical protein